MAAAWTKSSRGGQGKVVAPSMLRHVIRHKTLDVLKLDLDAEEDRSYLAASERFMELQTQLGAVLHHTHHFQKTLEEALQQAVELADDFGRISSGQAIGHMTEPWALQAGGQAFYFKAMLEESVAAMRQFLVTELEEGVMRSLREEVAAFSTVPVQMSERANMKVETLHYAKKLEELKGPKAAQKNSDEKMDRNKEKYAQASQALRDQTNQLMSVFAHAEQLRQRLVTRDLPQVIGLEKEAFDAFSSNLTKAAERKQDAATMPVRLSPPIESSYRPPHGSDSRLSSGGTFAEISLDDTVSPPRGGESSPPYDSVSHGSRPPGMGPPPQYSDVKKAESPSYNSVSHGSPPPKMGPPPLYNPTQTVVKKRTPTPVSPKSRGSPWAGSNTGGGEFGRELKRAQEHQIKKMEQGSDAPGALSSGTRPLSPPDPDSAPPTEVSSPAPPANNGEVKSSSQYASSGGKKPAAKPAEVAVPRVVDVSEDETDSAAETPDTPVKGQLRDEELPPGKVRVRALYDYDATQDGDLSFREGDIILADESASTGDGWVTGECHGNVGIFPANYTEPC